MKTGNDVCKARQLTLRKRATAPISSSNNLVRAHYSAALFSLNSPLWYRSDSCILKSLGYRLIKTESVMMRLEKQKALK
ncbi:hypothetical protein [Vibrio caribbeanicus]|uniref:hypothetical protein n=1 Tax=Vibrio caribbeanicus TaxID=701175 RepID=UPI001111D477